MWRWVLVFGAAAGFVTGLACSGPPNLGQAPEKLAGPTTTSSTAHDSGTTAFEDAGGACSNFVAAKCAKLGACTEGFYTLQVYSSEAECEAREMLTCLAQVAAADTTTTPSGLQGCAQAITTSLCGDFFDSTNVAPACLPPRGPRANGAPCAFDGQCHSTWCYAAATATCGTCATSPDAGAPCGTNADCGNAGMVCAQSGMCAPLAGVGAPCGASSPCAFDLTCVGPADGGPTTCEADGTTLGAKCDGAHVKAPLCADIAGLFCPSATDDCAAATLSASGESCGVTPGDAGKPGVIAPSHLARCTSGGACLHVVGIAGDTCVPPAPEAAPCDTALGPPCLAPARCVLSSDASTAGTCAILGVTNSCN